GLKEKALKAGSSYIEITPRIGEVSADSNKNYLEALLGRNGSATRNAQRTTKDKDVARRTLSVERSEIAALVRSDVRFLKEVSPKNWRRELAGVVKRMSDLIAEETGRVKAKKAIRDYLKAAIFEIPQEVPVASSVARSESRKDPGLSELYNEINEIAKGKADGFGLLRTLDVRDFKETAGIILKTLDAGASSSQIASAKNFLLSYQNYAGNLRKTSRSEMREDDALAGLKSALAEIAEGKADGFDLLKLLDIRDYKVTAGLHLEKLGVDPNAENIASAKSFVSSYQKYANSFRRPSLGAPQPTIFNFSEIDLRGFEDLRPSQFLNEKGVDLESLRGSSVHILSKRTGTVYAITISREKNLVVPLMLDTMAQVVAAPRMNDVSFIRAERAVSRSEARGDSEVEPLRKKLLSILEGEEDRVALFGVLPAWDYKSPANRYLKALGNGVTPKTLESAEKFIEFYRGYVDHMRSVKANQAIFRSETRNVKPFTGSFFVTADKKNRVSIPSVWRKTLSRNAELMAVLVDGGQRLRIAPFKTWPEVFFAGRSKD
ncbi:MAG: MraZ N-terminal domain containing protein, partial [Candidatus Omnitrophica bacterium]|nr:MraZ N-terminal domain containing protein [Candidatus Omnitrophota bacterium]